MSKVDDKTTPDGTTPDVTDTANGSTSNENYDTTMNNENNEPVNNETQQTTNKDTLLVGQRKSERVHKPTDRMLDYMDQESKRREKRIQLCFDRWKFKVRECRQNVKIESSEEDLGNMLDEILKLEREVIEAFEHLHVATKRVQLESIKKEEEQQTKFEALQEQQRKLLETQQREVRKLQAEKSVAMAEARLKAYSDLMQGDVNIAAATSRRQTEHDTSFRSRPTDPPAVPTIVSHPLFTPVVTSTTHPTVTHTGRSTYTPFNPPTNNATVNSNSTTNDDSTTSILAKVFADSVNLNRLPIPEPSVFTGDPLRFVEWKTAFHALIELEAALHARQVLQDRYGHPFVMQKAFRKRLENWPKITEGNSKALRDFGDFLQACRDATPQVPSLKILDDCSENQKLLSKLPNWAALRWNRQVQETIDSTGEYPLFSKFVDFVVKEARIACNPVSSIYALKDTDTKPAREHKNSSHKANVLATNSTHQHNATGTDMRPNLCDYCEKEGHPLFKCEKFINLSIEDKRVVVRKKNLCFGCLRKGHRNKDCKKKHTCGICKGKHPTCMHEDESPTRKQQLEVKEASSFRVSRGYGHSTSMIVPVWLSVQENPSHEILTYALLDTQSDTTFVLDETAAALHVNRQPTRLSFSTMTSQHTIINSFRIQNLRELSNELPPLQSCEVGLLIGYNCPQALVPKRTLTGNENQPYGIQTLLGWSVVGYTDHTDSDVTVVCHRTSVKELHSCTPRDVIKTLEKDFAHDKNEDIKISQDDIAFLNFMKENIQQHEDKHLEMPLPFKERPSLPNNKSLALIRLNHLKRKLKRDQTYQEHYKTFMREVLERGDAEPVSSDGVSGNTWYIPHHGVYHPKKPGKLRVVFDCSARFKEASLNEYLLTGPDLTNALTGVLCRFRQHPVAVMCDVEKMFHQFVVHEADRDFLRFLWWEDGNLDAEPKEYRMRVHLFGAASSPGCANYGLKFLAKSQEEQLQAASFFVQNNFYVDDGLTSVETEEEAIKLIQDAQILCANGGLRLHKFISNNKNVINSVAESERAADVKDLDLSHEQLPMEQALGIKWNIEEDAFCFKAVDQNASPTRRSMLSIVASIFDPLGFLSPFTLTGKRILQEICQGNIGWNDPLPADRLLEWEAWIKDLQNLDLIKVPRCLIPSDFGKPITFELHHFSDASTNGYGQCSYLRVVKGTKVHCALVIAKARVAPLKVVTIPRLELTAAVLSVKVSLFLKRELNLPINREYFWTDSKVVLGYINNEARRFHVFVANRVQMIRDATKPHQWLYIESASNPADHASRGLRASEVNDSSWLTGPPLLWQSIIESKGVETELQLGDPEVRSARTLCTKSKAHSSILDILSRFSSWTKMISFIARMQRLANGVKGTYPPNPNERLQAEQTIIKQVQHETFQDAISALEKSEGLPKSNSLKPLEPILQDGILRVGGRLRKATLSAAYKNPIILPRNGHITHLILSHAHKETFHQGRGITLNKLRSLGYWIVGGSKTVASYIRQCVICRKLRRPTETQRMADLPKERMEPSLPFTYCGMDCFGPFIVKQGRKEIKRYGLLFTCMCSRAIHIEMLDDMSTDAFINGLRCFIAIRGTVRQLRSDQGTNFIGAKNEFQKALNKERICSFLAEKHCEFVFNAPSASHTGGVWERQIRTVRNILNAILLLCPGRLDDSSLRTIFYEAMSIVNGRPLTVSEIDNPDSLEPLTPNHILTGKTTSPLPPPGEFVKEDMYVRKRWRRVQYLMEQFWSRWRHEYLAQITLRQKWHGVRRNIKEGDIVLVKDVDLPRNQWPLGRVVEANPDDDGLVRRVKVKMQSGVLERTVHKLVLLIAN
ncbi:uncharacterized protein LOC134262527 [Saccostrea cucullata]|uniref:uncharacterized protein LOC134262527 n=1 Tax=Saccostrea cuccullata TaxID=36930 RepID=UPI002ED2573F